MQASEFAALLHAKPLRRGRWVARCPAHGDRHASLSIGVGKKHPVVWKCMSQGCTQAEILAAMGLTWKDVLGEPRLTPELRRKLRDERELREWQEVFCLLNSCAIWGGISLRAPHIAVIDYKVRCHIRRLTYKLEHA